MKIFKLFLLISSGLLLFGMLVFSIVVSFYSRNLPTLDALKNYEPRLVTKVFDKDDQIVSEFSTERRVALKPEEMPQTAIDAFVAAEDDEFFNHRGVNPVTFMRAVIVNLSTGRKAQGGSTITQQVARSILLTPEKSYARKIKEIILSFQMERAFSKQEILNIYLNQIFLGSGAYGIEAASQTFFGKPAKDLTVPEAAILAGLPKAPSRDNPIVNPKAAKQRQSYVLRRLLETNRITRDEYDEYKETPVKIFNRNLDNVGQMPYFSEHVRRYLVSKYGTEKVYEGGLKVYTTIDTNSQLSAQRALKTGLIDLDKRIGLRAPIKLLKGPAEIEKFLKDKHQHIVDNEFNYKILSPAGELTPAVELTAPTPLVKGQVYEAVVVEKDIKTKSLIVQVGNLRGLIKKEDYAWAAAANPEEIYKEKIIRNPFNDYKVGHVLGVLVKNPEADPKNPNTQVDFVLSQNPIVQGAMLSYRMPSGELNAMIGGYDFYVTKSEFNRATQAIRQPGSSFKPIVYAAGLEAGLTPATILVDSPIIYNNSGEQTEMEKVWKPGNYSDKFYGDTTLRNSLAFSRNIPSIKLLQHLKVSTVIEFSRKLGIKSPLNADLTLALGGSGMSLEELTGAWGVFANQGRKLPVHFIRKVEDRDGNILEEYKNEGDEQIMHEGNAFLMSSMLQSVVQYGTATVVQEIKRPVAGKTGTTSDYKDALFVGYVPQIITSVWVGFDEDRPIGRNETGNRAPASIWLDYMKDILKDVPVQSFQPPASVVQVQVDSETGDVPNAKTKKRMTEYFVNGSAPGQTWPQDGIPGMSLVPKAGETQGQAAGTGPLASGPAVNRTKVITGNATVNTESTSTGNPDDVGTDELFRNEM